jgi:hypothetical protein
LALPVTQAFALSVRQGASLTQRRWRNKESLSAMGRDTAYWYRRGRGVPVGEGRVTFVKWAAS